jgi:hypothetical protein
LPLFRDFALADTVMAMHVPNRAVAFVVSAIALVSLGGSWLLSESNNIRVITPDPAFHSSAIQGVPERLLAFLHIPAFGERLSAVARINIIC